MDIEIARCTRRCAASGREFAPGEVFYSLLKAQGAELVRCDYAAENWPGPQEDCVGWWKSRMPDRDEKRGKLAPNEVLLQLFRQLESQPEKQDMRYVLALLLTRRRVLQVEHRTPENAGNVMTLYCPRDETTYHVPAILPDEQRINEIQDELARLLFADVSEVSGE
jgi:hypothetical protein